MTLSAGVSDICFENHTLRIFFFHNLMASVAVTAKGRWLIGLPERAVDTLVIVGSNILVTGFTALINLRFLFLSIDSVFMRNSRDIDMTSGTLVGPVNRFGIFIWTNIEGNVFAAPGNLEIFFTVAN